MKKILFILILFFSLSFTAFTQDKTSAPDPVMQAKVLSFYPNPASAVINFDFLKNYNRTHKITIYNFIGRPVLEVKNLNTRNIVNLDAFYRGIYIFKLIDRNGVTIESGKFQVVK